MSSASAAQVGAPHTPQSLPGSARRTASRRRELADGLGHVGVEADAGARRERPRSGRGDAGAPARRRAPYGGRAPGGGEERVVGAAAASRSSRRRRRRARSPPASVSRPSSICSSTASTWAMPVTRSGAVVGRGRDDGRRRRRVVTRAARRGSTRSRSRAGSTVSRCAASMPRAASALRWPGHDTT